ncbi:uncharacterized protein K444DRAFT_617886 [Hyaloscypha bicolor E]|uniref:Uncharacterized protein n=1 Tax=Hyaloscypha bicolor E TaxID=1095630 RepID=A0A2J6SUT4_9HELO|nr:uncharacterized protein K444DRAFT_617886 [Hyaloscypha bicolor E]PMD54537.1 hypothetical protein K444DRAFT_617886 [Hyaloscypha bicolor E]
MKIPLEPELLDTGELNRFAEPIYLFICWGVSFQNYGFGRIEKGPKCGAKPLAEFI